MTRATSVYLDALRFLLALLVFLSHVGTRAVTEGFLWQAAPLGRAAVVLFFVLSGYVIGAATEPPGTLRGYAAARAGRLYSVAIPALLLTALLDAIGRGLRPDLYPFLPLTAPPPWRPLLWLGFLGESWGLDDTPGSDLPWWSLCYEAPYYALYGIWRYARGRRWALPALLAIALLAGPKVMLLFPLWLMGLCAWRARAAAWLTIGRARALTSGVALLALLFVVLAEQPGGLLHSPRPLHYARPAETAQHYAIAALFALHLLALPQVLRVRIGDRLARPVRALAGLSFGLYLYHRPMLLFLAAVLPMAHDGAPYRVLAIAGGLALSLGLAALTEPHKRAWARLFRRLLRVPRVAGV